MVSPVQTYARATPASQSLSPKHDAPAWGCRESTAHDPPARSSRSENESIGRCPSPGPATDLPSRSPTRLPAEKQTANPPQPSEGIATRTRSWPFKPHRARHVLRVAGLDRHPCPRPGRHQRRKALPHTLRKSDLVQLQLPGTSAAQRIKQRRNRPYQNKRAKDENRRHHWMPETAAQAGILQKPHRPGPRSTQNFY